MLHGHLFRKSTRTSRVSSTFRTCIFEYFEEFLRARAPGPEPEMKPAAWPIRRTARPATRFVCRRSIPYDELEQIVLGVMYGLPSRGNVINFKF